MSKQNEQNKKPQVKHFGLDVGTMNLVASYRENDEIVSKFLRNVFLDIDSDLIGTMDLTHVQHAKIDDIIYILGEDAYNFGNIFGQAVKRPMKKGMISPTEADSLEILAIMVRELIGKNESDQEAFCCYSIPADPIDTDMNVIYHKNVFHRIIQGLGYTPEPLNEATAIILNECENENFTGIGISFGAGMTNIAIVYKTIPVITFSVARGGDWIDENAAMSIGSIPNRVTFIKEKPDFTLLSFDAPKKKEKKIREAIIYYYTDLLNYVIKLIVKKFNEITADLPDALSIIVSGGTSKANGFIDLFKQQIENYELPFELKEIRPASNQLTAVSQGCLIKALKLAAEKKES